MKKVDAQIHELMKTAASGTGKHNEKGYLPQKNRIPKTFDDEYSQWRQWREDVEDYVDTARGGMKKFLKKIVKMDGITDELRMEASKDPIIGPLVTGDGVELWRALKGLTTGEARKVVAAVKEEDGFQLPLGANLGPTFVCLSWATLAPGWSMLGLH